MHTHTHTHTYTNKIKYFFKWKATEEQNLRLTSGFHVHTDTCALAHNYATYSRTHQAKQNESVHTGGQGLPCQKSNPRESLETEDQR